MFKIGRFSSKELQLRTTSYPHDECARMNASVNGNEAEQHDCMFEDCSADSSFRSAAKECLVCIHC